MKGETAAQIDGWIGQRFGYQGDCSLEEWSPYHVKYEGLIPVSCGHGSTTPGQDI